MKSLIIAALLIGATASGASALRTTSSHLKHDPTPNLAALHEYTFEHYEKAYEKTYDSPADRASRKAIFEENLAKIRAHNANPTKTFTMNVNHMADWSRSEFKALMGQIPSTVRNLHEKLGIKEHAPILLSDHGMKALPPSVDWRNKSVVTPVKDQGGCGSCWAFASTETMESHWAIKTGQLYELSTQQVTECTPNPDHCGGSGGCEGATENLAFQYIIESGGITTAKAYPYSGTDTGCHVPADAPRVANFSSIVKVKTNDQEDMMTVVATQGPVTIGVWADPMQFYFGGVFNGCSYTSNMDIDHAVQLVGYGTDASSGLDYWIVRNSWGSMWGEAGYIRLQRDKEVKCGMDETPADGSACKNDPNTPIKVCGQCGILFESSYAVPKV